MSGTMHLSGFGSQFKFLDADCRAAVKEAKVLQTMQFADHDTATTRPDMCLNGFTFSFAGN